MSPGPDHREGDARPFKHERGTPLTFWPASDEPFRWLPRHGEPLCVGEWLSQHVVKAVAFLPVYIAIVVTASLYVLVFGVPFIDGK